MGNTIVSDNKYYVYRRQLSSDAFINEPILTLNTCEELEALSIFKHETYCFGLNNSKYIDTKAIYLYHGSKRICKAIIQSENKQLEIWSSAIRQYLQCEEKSAKAGKPIKYCRLFHNKYQENYVWLDTQTIGFASTK
jgi:hypothetical protein